MLCDAALIRDGYRAGFVDGGRPDCHRDGWSPTPPMPPCLRGPYTAVRVGKDAIIQISLPRRTYADPAELSTSGSCTITSTPRSASTASTSPARSPRASSYRFNAASIWQRVSPRTNTCACSPEQSSDIGSIRSRSFLDTWVTVHSEHIGNTSGPNGFWIGSSLHVSSSK